MTTTALAKANAAFDKLSPELKEVAIKIRDIVNEVDSADVIGRFTIGQYIKEVMEKENVYGSNAAIDLAGALAIDVQDLYKCQSLADAWTLAEFKKIVARTTENGRGLSYSHFVELARIDKASMRETLVNRAIAKSLTVRELAAIVTEKLGVRTNNPAGRGAGGPKTPMAAVTLLDKHVSLIAKQGKTILERMDDSAETADKLANADFINKLKGTAEHIDTALNMLGQGKRKCNTLAQELQAIMRGQERQSKLPSTNGKAHGSKAKKKLPVKMVPVNKKPKLKLRPKAGAKPKLLPRKKLKLKPRPTPVAAASA